MIALGGTLFALGGQHHTDGSTVDTIEVYNASLESWAVHPSRLMSNSTSGLAVTALPLSAVSCNQGCQCGVGSAARIVGGEEAEALDHPWMGLLLTEGETRANYSRCATTMIGSNVFLTAAHCLQNWAGVVQAPSQLKIILGVQNRRKLTSTARELHVTDLILHKDFNFTRQVNDIALLKTREQVNLLDFPPVCLPSTGQSFAGLDGKVAGWGSTEASFTSDDLKEVEVPISGPIECEANVEETVL